MGLKSLNAVTYVARPLTDDRERLVRHTLERFGSALLEFLVNVFVPVEISNPSRLGGIEQERLDLLVAEVVGPA
jgi:hypothetical protein